MTGFDGFRLKVLQVAGGTAIAQGLGALASPLLTRLYSPADFGASSSARRQAASAPANWDSVKHVHASASNRSASLSPVPAAALAVMAISRQPSYSQFNLRGALCFGWIRWLFLSDILLS